MPQRPKRQTRKTPPSFDLYPDDLVAGTADFCPAAMGCYVRLLCYQWSHGFVPSERRKLLRITGALEHEFDEVFNDLMTKFVEVGPGQLQNERMQRERVKALERIKKRSAAGKIGANKRYSNRIANASESHQKTHANGMAKGRGHVEEGSNQEKEEVDSPEIEFENWFDLYPRPVAIGAARVAWMDALIRIGELGICGDQSPNEWLIERTKVFAKSDKGKSRQCPYPETWLNEERYRDPPREWSDDRTPPPAPKPADPAWKQLEDKMIRDAKAAKKAGKSPDWVQDNIIEPLSKRIKELKP